MKMRMDLSGIWKFSAGEYQGEIALPDSLSNSGVLPENDECAVGYMTDTRSFVGIAVYEREFELTKEQANLDLVLYLERTRKSTVWIDGVQIGQTEESFATPHEHVVSSNEARLSEGKHTLAISVENENYKTPGGHMTSPDTQTNWNGILGAIELRGNEPHTAIKNLFVDAFYDHNECFVSVKGDVESGSEKTIRFEVERCYGDEQAAGEDSFNRIETKTYCGDDGSFSLRINLGEHSENMIWDEYHHNLFTIRTIYCENVETRTFGVRNLATAGLSILVNDCPVFLRGKHDGLVFPKTGYAPMDKEEWKRVMSIASMEYGINHYRFHTCTPPEAAFAAADELGIYLEPELPFWGTIAAPGEEQYHEEEQAFLIEEGFRIMKAFGHHPSFFMMSLGNELWGSAARLDEILKRFKDVDSRHLYSAGSNNFQFYPVMIEHEDVFSGVRFTRDRLFRGSYAMCDAPLGRVQLEAPNSVDHYDQMILPVASADESENVEEGAQYVEIQYQTGVKRVKVESSSAGLIPNVPVVSHEVGQYSFYPDFDEASHYTGSIKPRYLEVFKQRLQKNDLFTEWKRFYAAAGHLAVDCYKQEIENALRTENLSGFQLLDLQDFPGQGVALVGVLNSLYESKGLVTSKQWKGFCSDTVLMACLPKYVYTTEDIQNVDIAVSLGRPELFGGSFVICELTDDASGRVIAHFEVQLPDEIPSRLCVVKDAFILDFGKLLTNSLTTIGSAFSTSGMDDALIGDAAVAAHQLTLHVRMNSPQEAENTYRLFVCPAYADVEITEHMIKRGEKQVAIVPDLAAAKELKKQGRSVLCIPGEFAKGESVEGTYCTDFWNYPMFRSISESMSRPVPVGTLGMSINPDHLALAGFPTADYSTPQWFQIVMHSQAAVLDQKPGVENVIAEPIDNVERCHRLGMLYEEDGVLVCTSRLYEIGSEPEVRCFAASLLEYLD